MSYIFDVRRGGDARGLWKLADHRKSAVPIPPLKPSEVLILRPPVRYHACEDPLFPGEWRVEPVKYAGRGVVYLFRGEDARFEAMAWAKHKNAELK